MLDCQFSYTCLSGAEMPYFAYNNILVLHVPKTGGTSLEKYFMMHDPAVRIKGTWARVLLRNQHKYLYSQDAVPPFSHSRQHCTYEEIKEHFSWVVDKSPRILVTTRNPYDRLISELFYRYASTGVQGNAQEFVEEHLIEFEKEIETSGYGVFDNHARPQSHFVRGLPEGAVFIRMESIKDDMHKAGFTNFDLHENKNNSGVKDYRDLLTPTVREFVLKHYSEDFDVFGYSKDYVKIGTQS